MRILVSSALFLLAASSAYGAKKVISPTTSASNEQVDIVATIVLEEDQVRQKLGADPGKGIVLLEVRVIPKTDQPVHMTTVSDRGPLSRSSLPVMARWWSRRKQTQ